VPLIVSDGPVPVDGGGGADGDLLHAIVAATDKTIQTRNT
jgi:hypothetical protein